VPPPPLWPPPPLSSPPLPSAALNVTAACAVAAGGAPVQVMAYLNNPAADSVSDIVPESGRVPAQPSLASPPNALHALALWELQLSVT